MKSLDRRKISIIADAIVSCTEFPNIQNLASLTKWEKRAVKKVIEGSRRLKKQLREKTRTYIYGLEEPEFTDSVRSTGWIRNMPKEAQAVVYQRADEILLREVSKLRDQIISNNALSDRTRFSGHFIKKRITMNRILRQAIKNANMGLVDSLDDRKLIRMMGIDGWYTNAPSEAKNAIDRRVNKIILDTIRNFDGIVGYRKLARKISWGSKGVQNRIENTPRLREAFRIQPLRYIRKLSEDELKRKTQQKGWATQFPQEVKDEIQKRIRKMILRGVRTCYGVPTFSKVARKISWRRASITWYTDRDPVLAHTFIEKSRRYIDSLNDDQFLKMYAKESNEFGNVRKEIKQMITSRLDGIILNAIRTQRQGNISAPILSSCLNGFSEATILYRLERNQQLWTEYYKKKGLSIDQAIELEVERRLVQTPSTAHVLSKRLANLQAFREMIGIVRCFGSTLHNADVLEVSLYPDPLGNAAKLIGQSMQVTYCAMQPFRRVGTIATLATPGVHAAVIQGIHRLATEGLTRLFGEVHRNLVKTGRPVIATYGLYSALEDGFAQALLNNGFEIKEHGLLVLDPPSDATLLSLGVKKADLERVRRKVYGSSHVLVLDTVRKTVGGAIPQLVNLRDPDRMAGTVASAKTIDVPPGVNSALKTTFLQIPPKSLSAQPFLVEVEEKGQVVAVLGYDMHPRQKRMIESVIYPGAPTEDYSSLARRLATNLQARQRLGVVGTLIQRIPLQRIKLIP